MKNDLNGDLGAVELFPRLLPLLGALTKLPLVRDKIDAYECYGELPVKSIYKKWRLSNLDEALALTVSSEELRPEMQGIHYDADRKVKVSVDGGNMSVIPYEGGEESQTVNPKSGEILDVKFPNWAGVVPTEFKYECDINLLEVLAKVRGVLRANRFITGAKVHIAIEVPDDYTIVLYAESLEKCLLVLTQTGSTRATVKYNAFNKGLILQKSEKFCLMMPNTDLGEPINLNKILYTTWNL